MAVGCPEPPDAIIIKTGGLLTRKLPTGADIYSVDVDRQYEQLIRP